MSGKYDREFKLEAIRLSEEEGSSAAEVERRLGIGQGGTSHWKRQLGAKGDSAFPGKGHQRGLEETVRRLQRECERLRRERDILKKAVAIFSADR
jgi:transposase